MCLETKKLRNTNLCNTWIKEDTTMKIKYYVSNLWDEVNAIFRKSFTALHTLIRNKKG